MYRSTTSLFLSVLCLYFSDTAALVAPLPPRFSTHTLATTAGAVVIEAPTTTIPTTTTPLIITTTQPDETTTTTRRQYQDSSKNHRRHTHKEDLWEVKVYNDNINTHEWVARCLVVVASQSEWQAYQTTKLAHLHGEACLGVWEQELAQRYVDGLRMEGIVVDMFPIQDFQ